MKQYTYVPILRWKRGERVGISHVTAAGREEVMPLFVMGTDQYVGRAKTNTRPAMNEAHAAVAEMMNIWNDSLYLDAEALKPKTAGGAHPLIAIANRARMLGLNIVPATTLNAPALYQSAVGAVAKADGRGVALRVDLNEFSSAAAWVSSWAFQRSDTDLVLDLADNAPTVNSLGAGINGTFAGLHEGADWRTVTLAGTSMPPNFQGYLAGPHTIDRAEVALWRRLSKLGLPYRLDFGDYATVSVTPAPSGIQWGYPINVKYTIDGKFLICRGVGTTGAGGVDMDVQLLGHARTIKAYPHRALIATAWGDTRIDNIVAGTEPPGSLEGWVQISVNRHIEFMRSNLP